MERRQEQQCSLPLSYQSGKMPADKYRWIISKRKFRFSKFQLHRIRCCKSKMPGDYAWQGHHISLSQASTWPHTLRLAFCFSVVFQDPSSCGVFWPDTSLTGQIHHWGCQVASYFHQRFTDYAHDISSRLSGGSWLPKTTPLCVCPISSYGRPSWVFSLQP